MPGDALALYPSVAPAGREHGPKIALNVPKTGKTGRIPSGRYHHALTERKNN